MKTKFTLFCCACLVAGTTMAQDPGLQKKDLTGSAQYKGQGDPSNSGFNKDCPNTDIVTFTQLPEGYNFKVTDDLASPVRWYVTSANGFNLDAGYSVEIKAAIPETEGNGLNIELQGLPGQRVHLSIDATTIWNLTYGSKEPIVDGLDNTGMHTYRVAVTEDAIAYIFMDGRFLEQVDVDGPMAGDAIVNTEEEPLVKDLFEEYTEDFPSKPFTWPNVNAEDPADNYSTEPAFIAECANNLPFGDIVWSNWGHLGVDTIAANVKEGKNSVWFRNGTTGQLTMRFTDVPAGDYKLSFWIKFEAGYQEAKGSVFMEGGDALTTMYCNANTDYALREYQFTVSEDGNVVVQFHNGWDGAGTWAGYWFDDLTLQKVENVPYFRFGKDSNMAIENMTIGHVSYDMTGAYAQYPTGVENNFASDDLKVYFADQAVKARVSLTDASDVTMQVVNMNGQIVKSQTFAAEAGANNLTMSAPELNAGVYTVRLIDNANSVAAKVVVK